MSVNLYCVHVFHSALIGSYFSELVGWDPSSGSNLEASIGRHTRTELQTTYYWISPLDICYFRRDWRA